MPSCADAGSLVVPRSQEMLQGSCTPGLLTGPWLNQTHSFKNQAKRLVPEAVYDHRNVVSLSPRDRSIQLTHPTQELSFTGRIVSMVEGHGSRQRKYAQSRRHREIAPGNQTG